MSRVIASKRKEGVKHFESPFHDLECRAPQLMQLELSRGSTQPRTSDNRAFLLSVTTARGVQRLGDTMPPRRNIWVTTSNQIGCELVHQWQQGTQLLCSPQPTDSEKAD